MHDGVVDDASTRSREFWEGRYRAAAEQGTSLWGEGPNGWIAEQVAALAPAAGLALDLGAGEGRNTRWLAEHGWRVVATDFAPAAVDRLRASTAGLAVEAVVADATAWSSPEPADLAILCYLQLPAEALASAIGRAGESLAPGGLLLGIWHDREDVARGLGGAMTPVIRTTPAETAAAAEAAGLRVELSGRRDRETSAGLACDCLLVARRA
jgi:SAM-dependent methyltransferase